MSRILVTGATGFLGGVIVEELSFEHSVDTLSRSASTYNVDLAKDILIIDKPYDIIVHAAGKAHMIPTSSTEAEEFMQTNVNGTRKLLEAFQESFLPKSFIFISSVAVYGRSSGQLLTEEEPLAATDAYGVSKIICEEIVTEWGTRNGVKVVILRLPLIAGINPPGNLGDMIRAIRRGFYVNIAAGQVKKSMVSACDVARAIPKVCNSPGIYNLTDGQHPTFYELGTFISNQLGKSKPYHLPLSLAKIIARCGDFFSFFPLNTNKLLKITSELTFDDTKARKTWGWSPRRIQDYLIFEDKVRLD